MAKPSVSLLVHVPACTRYIGEGQKFPVLLHVDPPEANIEASVLTHGNSSKNSTISTENADLVGPFNKIVWIDNLPEGVDHTLCIQASTNDNSLVPALHRCKIRRERSQKNKKPNQGVRATAPSSTLVGPIICGPANGSTVGQNFLSYGYVNPTTDPVSVWLTDGNGNVYPGTPVVPPPQGYDWGASFMGIPIGNYTLYAEDTNTSAISSIDITVQ